MGDVFCVPLVALENQTAIQSLYAWMVFQVFYDY